MQLVTDSQWKKIPLRSPQPQPASELKNIAELTETAIDGCHYYCETRDLTRPFPSGAPVGEPDKEYVWNEWLAAPFKRIGLPGHCVVLLQVGNRFCVMHLFRPHGFLAQHGQERSGQLNRGCGGQF